MLAYNVGCLLNVYFIYLWLRMLKSSDFRLLVTTDDAVKGSWLLCHITGIHKPHRSIMGPKFINPFNSLAPQFSLKF
jgi:hypothetical protein